MTAYRTVRAAPPPADIRDAIKSGGFDAVCFTSSSTVRNLVGIAGKPHARTVVACIGPQTAATAREFGLRVGRRAGDGRGGRAGRRAGRVRGGAAASPATRPRRRRRPGAASLVADRAVSTPGFPVARPRRLRRSAPLRRLVSDVAAAPGRPDPADVRQGGDRRRRRRSPPCPASSSTRWTRWRKAAYEAVSAGVGGLILFGIPAVKDASRVRGRRPGRDRAGGAAAARGRGRRRDRADDRPVPGRVHRPRALRRAAALRRGRQRRDAGALRVDRGRAGRRRAPRSSRRAG